MRDEFVTIVSGDHALAGHSLDLVTYLDLQHMLVSPEGQVHGHVDQMLAQLGRKRKLALTVPHVFAVSEIVARTRMAATILKRVALHDKAGHRLALFPPPLALPEIVFHLIWHRRSDPTPRSDGSGMSSPSSQSTHHHALGFPPKKATLMKHRMRIVILCDGGTIMELIDDDTFEAANWRGAARIEATHQACG